MNIVQKVLIGAIKKNPEILKFIPDYHKTKEICKHGVKKLSFEIYIHDWCKTQQTCDKAFLENGETLKSPPNCYKDQ